jgi:hypothetical protein
MGLRDVRDVRDVREEKAPLTMPGRSLSSKHLYTFTSTASTSDTTSDTSASNGVEKVCSQITREQLRRSCS